MFIYLSVVHKVEEAAQVRLAHVAHYDDGVLARVALQYTWLYKGKYLYNGQRDRRKYIL